MIRTRIGAGPFGAPAVVMTPAEFFGILSDPRTRVVDSGRFNSPIVGAELARWPDANRTVKGPPDRAPSHVFVQEF